jgi:hypothetical protein
MERKISDMSYRVISFSPLPIAYSLLPIAYYLSNYGKANHRF